MWRPSLAYLFLGAGVLLPWNAFVSTTYESMGASHVDRAITLVYLPVTLASTLLLALTCGESALARPRIVGGFTVYVVCTLVAPLVGNLWGLLALVAAAGVADAAAQGALFGLAGETDAASLSNGNLRRNSKINTQSLVCGTSISGIVTSVLNIVTRAAAGVENRAACFYFWTVAALCATCVVVCVSKLPVDDDRNSLTGSSPPPMLRSEPITSHLMKILKKARVPLVALTSTYWVTITIFPGIILENVHDAADGAWVAPIATFVFNVCDAVGKVLPPLPMATEAVLLAVTVSRALFVPVFLASVHAHPALICFLVGALGLTNGLLTVSTLAKVQLAVDEDDEYLAGNVALLFLMAGLNIGAATSWLFT